jgi:hypothetical protein
MPMHFSDTLLNKMDVKVVSPANGVEDEVSPLEPTSEMSNFKQELGWRGIDRDVMTVRLIIFI